MFIEPGFRCYNVCFVHLCIFSAPVSSGYSRVATSSGLSNEEVEKLLAVFKMEGTYSDFNTMIKDINIKWNFKSNRDISIQGWCGKVQSGG